MENLDYNQVESLLKALASRNENNVSRESEVNPRISNRHKHNYYDNFNGTSRLDQEVEDKKQIKEESNHVS